MGSVQAMTFHWDCLEWCRTYPRQALHIAAGGVVAGLLLVGAWKSFGELTRPPIPVMLDWRIENAPGNHKWLVMTYESHGASSCTRVGSYLLARPGMPDRLPDYIPIGSALNGSGLGSKPGQFHVWLDVSGVPSGGWNFTYRTFHMCKPLGLIEWPDPGKQIEVLIP